VLASGSVSPGAAPPTSNADPLKGVVVSGNLLSCPPWETEWSAEAWVTPLDKDEPSAKVEMTLADMGAPRWQVGHGAFWLNAVTGGVARRSLGHVEPEELRGYLQRMSTREGVIRAELPDLLKGEAAAFTKAPRDARRVRFGSETPSKLVRSIAVQQVEFDWVIETDLLPVGPCELRQFVLRNFAGWPTYLGRRKEGPEWKLPELTRDEQKTPSWSFTVYRRKQEWDGKRLEWKGGRWEEEEWLPAAIDEPFQVIGKGDDYFFVTRSGRLYSAPKPAKGKRRAIERIYDDPRRIYAFVTDHAAGRTFLFCRRSVKDGEPCFFELGGKPEPVAFDPSSVKQPKADEPLKTLLICARVLAAKGLLKEEKKK
jgi:hypothetical protein